MASGKYFNKGVKALDAPYIGHVVRETDDTIVVFGEGDERYDIPVSAIRFVSGNVLIDANFHEIVQKYRVKRDAPLPSTKKDPWPNTNNVDLASYEKEYPKSLFNKGVRSQDEEHIGHVMKETDDMIVVWGHYDWRFDLPKSKIIAVGRNVIIGMDYKEVFKYKVDRNAPLPTGEPVEKLAEDLPFEEGAQNIPKKKLEIFVAQDKLDTVLRALESMNLTAISSDSKGNIGKMGYILTLVDAHRIDDVLASVRGAAGQSIASAGSVVISDVREVLKI